MNHVAKSSEGFSPFLNEVHQTNPKVLGNESQANNRANMCYLNKIKTELIKLKHSVFAFYLN